MAKPTKGEGLQKNAERLAVGERCAAECDAPSNVRHVDFRAPRRKLATTAEAAGGLVHVRFVRAVDHIWLTPAQARLWADGIAQLADTAAEQEVDDA